MKTILFIQSSPRGAESYSQQAARSVVNDLVVRTPTLRLWCVTWPTIRRRTSDRRLSAGFQPSRQIARGSRPRLWPCPIY